MEMRCTCVALDANRDTYSNRFFLNKFIMQSALAKLTPNDQQVQALLPEIWSDDNERGAIRIRGVAVLPMIVMKDDPSHSIKTCSSRMTRCIAIEVRNTVSHSKTLGGCCSL